MTKAWNTSAIQMTAIKVAALCVIRMSALIGNGHVAGKRYG